MDSLEGLSADDQTTLHGLAGSGAVPDGPRRRLLGTLPEGIGAVSLIGNRRDEARLLAAMSEQVERTRDVRIRRLQT